MLASRPPRESQQKAAELSHQSENRAGVGPLGPTGLRLGQASFCDASPGPPPPQRPALPEWPLERTGPGEDGTAATPSGELYAWFIYREFLKMVSCKDCCSSAWRGNHRRVSGQRRLPRAQGRAPWCQTVAARNAGAPPNPASAGCVGASGVQPPGRCPDGTETSCCRLRLGRWRGRGKRWLLGGQRPRPYLLQACFLIYRTERIILTRT